MRKRLRRSWLGDKPAASLGLRRGRPERSGAWTPGDGTHFCCTPGQRVSRTTDGAVPANQRPRPTRRSELHQPVPGSAAGDMPIGAAYFDFTNLDARRFVRESGTSFVSPSYRRIARTNPTTAATAAALVIVSAPLKIPLLIEAPSSLAKPSPPVTRPAMANAIQPYRSHPRSLMTPAERPPSNTGCVFRPSSSTAQNCLADDPSPQYAAGPFTRSNKCAKTAAVSRERGLLLLVLRRAEQKHAGGSCVGDIAGVCRSRRRLLAIDQPGQTRPDARPAASASWVAATVTSPPHVLAASERGASQQPESHPRGGISRRRSRGPRLTHPTIRRSARSVQTSPRSPTSNRTPSAPTADAYPKA